jgi:hypothetical protein
MNFHQPGELQVTVTATKETKPTTSPVSPVATEMKPPIKPLEQRRLKLICSSASDVGNHHAIVVSAGVNLDMIMEPAFWSNVAPQIRVADTIDVHSDGRDFYAKLYVREVARARVSVALIQHVEFGAMADTAEPAAHRVRYGGPHQKWLVERIADNRVMREGLENKEDADAAMKAIERSIDRKVA